MLQGANFCRDEDKHTNGKLLSLFKDSQKPRIINAEQRIPGKVLRPYKITYSEKEKLGNSIRDD